MMASTIPDKSLGYKVRRAATHPDRVVPFIRRAARNWKFAREGGDFSAFYRKVMADTAATEGANRAIGSFSEEHWLEVGQMQFDYLVKHGLRPDSRILDIGCGNLRAGWRLIDYLEAGCYTGIDISPDILMDAEQRLVQYRLADKRPYLYCIDGTTLDFLPASHFDVIHAHSVFSHTPLDVFDSYVSAARRLLKPDGFFDLTFIEDDAERSFVAEDFRYPVSTLVAVASKHGMTGGKLDDWDYSQAKLRLQPV
jgi:SAM-dependent methyltransferase